MVTTKLPLYPAVPPCIIPVSSVEEIAVGDKIEVTPILTAVTSVKFVPVIEIVAPFPALDGVNEVIIGGGK